MKRSQSSKLTKERLGVEKSDLTHEPDMTNPFINRS